MTHFVEAESQVGALTNVIKGKGDFVIGPMLDIRLPFSLGIEFDALYRRWEVEGGTQNGATKSSWEFPLYGKLRMPFPIVKPYAGAGVNFQRLGDLGRFVGSASIDTSRTGFLAAGGVELKVPVLRISPEVRYTYWPSKGALQSSNQFDFLVGISF